MLYQYCIWKHLENDNSVTSNLRGMYPSAGNARYLTPNKIYFLWKMPFSYIGNLSYLKLSGKIQKSRQGEKRWKTKCKYVLYLGAVSEGFKTSLKTRASCGNEQGDCFMYILYGHKSPLSKSTFFLHFNWWKVQKCIYLLRPFLCLRRRAASKTK